MKNVRLVSKARLSLIAISVILVLSITMGNTAISAKVLLNNENSTSVRGAIDEDFVPIGTTEELKKIGTDDGYPLSGKYRLTADVSMDQMIAGEFSGVFDGNGYTVDLSISNNSWDEGLFQTLSGTVENLITTGYVTRPNGASGQTGAIVGCLSGGTVRNCWNKANVSNGWEGNAGISGMLGGGTIINCYNTGTIAGAGRAGGIANSNTGAFTITNCYSSVCPTDGYYIAGGELQWSDPKIIENCYYFGDADRPGESHDWNSTVQGAAVKLTGDAITDPASYTDWDFENTWKMGANGPELIFEHVYYVEVTNGTADKRWAAEGDAVTVTADVPSGYSFAGWGGANGVTFTDGGAETATATFSVSSNISLNAQTIEDGSLFAGKGTEAEPYLIRSSADWDALSEYINNGGTNYSGKFFKLTKNIKVTTVLGNRPGSSDSEDRVFCGTFDGDGHTLEVDINVSGFAAPFAIAHNTTIKNLHVTGKVNSTSNHATGLVAASKGVSVHDESYLTVQNVTVSVDVSCNSHVAGVVGHAHKTVITMENVVFDGSISASSIQGGFIGWGGSANNTKFNASFKDCIFAGTYRSGASFHPVAYQSGQGTVTLLNDFYTTSLGSGGTPVTPDGNGQIKLFAATVEKNGTVNYFDSFAAASDSSNWIAGSTLKLWTDVTTGSTITVPSGEHTLDLNGRGIRMTGSGSVISVGNGATLNVEDSTPTIEHRFTVANAKSNGAGLATVNDALTSGYESFTGGYITGGNAREGGGIKVNGTAYLTLNGGTIIGNQSSFMGAGIKADNNGDDSNVNVTVNGGAVIYNTVSGYGAGICSDGGVTINGGTVACNVASNNPGGIHSHYLHLNGGRIENNFAGAADFAAGAHADHEVFISGDAVIYGNLCNGAQSNLDWDRPEYNHGHKLNVTGALGEEAKIGVRYGTTTGTGVFTSGWKNNMGDAEPSRYFTSDNSDYSVILNNNGEAEIVIPPAASVISGDTTTNYNAFSDALGAWTVGSTLKLTADVTTSGTVTVPSGEHTLDLNGHGIKAASAGFSVITVGSDADLTIVDSDPDNNDGGNRPANVTGGYVTGGSAGENFGGGVTVDGGTLTLRGGAISGNANTYGGIGNCGGGIHVKNGGEFYMEGGEISSNTSYVGGGVCTDSSATTVSITGGVIKNNITERFGSAIWAGRAAGATFRIGGDVEIVGNISKWTSDKDGEATVNFGSGLLLSGNPTVYGDWKTSGNSAPNTHINLDNVGNAIQNVELEGALTNDTGAPKITITPLYRWNDMANGKSFVFTKNWSKYMGDADPAEYFVCGNPAYKVFLNDSGEAEVGTPPAARITKGETSTKYGTFSDALNAWTEGSTLKLMSDVTTSSTITAPAGEHTLDLNGFNITRTGANGNDNSGLVIIVENGANLTVTGPGKITGGNGFHGGGIHVEGNGSLVLDNCEISGNAGHYGGGLYLKAGTITLKNGAIVRNNSASEGFGGSGIYAEGGGTLILEDCTFTGNRMNNGNQCAVFLCGNAKAQISGAPVIYDNTYNGEQKNLLFFQAGDQQSKIIFTGALTEGAKIGVRQTNYFGAITDGWNDKMGNAEISAFFKSDNADLMVVKNGSGELELIDKNTVAFVTAGSNNSYYTDFSSAVTAWLNSTDGAILQLYKDVTYNNNIILTDGKTRVFDLNGNTYTRAATGDGTVFDVNSGANFTLTDTSEEQTGVVTRESGDLGGTVLFTRDSGSVINFNGGTITGFTSRIVITWQGSTVNMSGGEISGNSLVNGDTVDGIVRTYSNTNEAGGTFNMTGGRIVNNTLGSGKTGGAVYVGNNGTFIISGDVEISGNTQDGNPVNVYLPTGKAIVIGDALTDGASIGITVESESSVFTSGWKDKMGDAEPDKYFVSDYIDYIFKMSGDEYLIGYPDLTGVSAEDFTGDYDGTAHYITVNVPEGVTVKYGTIEGSYTLDSNPGYTDVGTYTVYYQASKDKFIPVSGSATVTIDPINATVTIIGNNDTLEYNEAIHTVQGYKATANVDVYDVEKDFTFSGTAEVSRATVGTTAMGLTSDQFENTNKNFAKVTFLVTDGFLSIVPVDAEVTTAPAEKVLEYLEADQELVTEGAAYGGTMLYALGTDETTTPADAEFVRRIPTAKESGIYYVWYKVEGDANHNSLPAVCVKSVIADEEWGSLKGVLYQNDGETPLEGATVTLISGNQTVDTVVTKADGIYKFNVPSGVYNIVAEYEGETITVLATVTDETEQDIGMPEANTESILKVNSEDDTAIGVAVGGLDAEARSIRKNDNVPANQTVSVVMTVEAGTGITEEVDSAAAIYAVAANKRLEFFSVKVEKTVDSVTTVLEQTTNVLEIAISYPKTDRHDIALFACHGDEVRTFTESDSRAEGTFRIDKDAGTIFIYTDRFSLFAIGYTPYFTVNSVMTLGSFSGTVDVTLTSEDGEEVFNLNGVTMKDVKFTDIPMGEYIMTVTWKDGAENTLTLPVTVAENKAEDTAGADAAESALALDPIAAFGEGAAVSLDADGKKVSPAIPADEYDASPAAAESAIVADEADRAKYAKTVFAPAAYDFSKSRQKDRFRI
ncbi:MAG: hypothetical protein IJS45_10630 [Clostridia bacterium]|nr:hypothetical protein [Clostridia bacterium]